jgi:hypothetical protein
MKVFRKTILAFFVGCTIIFAWEVYTLEKNKNELKLDLVELSKIGYGLFNVDEWKEVLADVITKKIAEFDLEGTNKQLMKAKIEHFLTKAINEMEVRYYEEKSSSVYGVLQGGVAKLTGTFNQLKKDIPVFTDQILNFLNEKENRKAIRGYFIKKLNDYANSTFSSTDYSKINSILTTYEQEDITSAKVFLKEKINENQLAGEKYKWCLLIIAICSFLFIVFIANMLKVELLLLLALSFVYLVIGVLLPMIEIDARILEINFSLLGENIGFTNQILYYKSKSIIDVVQIMISQNKMDMLAVGMLVLLFSVLFPVTKLICSAYYLLSKNIRDNKLVSFMVFKSGKWSMADVLVIAIFMAFIGFDGIISEQLKQLEGLAKNVDLITTNNSDLLFGFYAFTTFVFMSVATSQKIQK